MLGKVYFTEEQVNQDTQTSTEVGTSTWANWLAPLGFFVLLLPGLRTISHSDFWLHLASGQSGFTKTETLTRASEGAAWVNMNWLYDLLLAGTWSVGGAPLVTIVHLLAVAVAFVLLVGIIRPQAGPAAIALALCLSGWLLAPRFEVRPEIFALLFGASYLCILSRQTPTWVPFAVLVPLQIVWANFDPSFIWGLLIVLLLAVQAYMDQPAGERSFDVMILPLGLFAALALASLVNPAGLGLYGVAFSTWLMPMMSDWISPVSGYFPSALARNLITLALIIGAIGLLTRRERLPLALTSLAMISAFLAVRAMPSFIGWFALFAFPFFCISLQALHQLVVKQLEKNDREGGIRIWQTGQASLVVLITVVTLFVIPSNGYYNRSGSFSVFGLGTALDPFPAEAVALIEHPAFPENFLNLPMDGAYLAYALSTRRPYVDHRTGLHGSQKLAMLAAGLAGDPTAWEDLQATTEPQALVINNLWPLAPETIRHLRQKGWVELYFDGSTTILLKDRPEFAELLEQRDQWLRAGLQRLEERRREVRAGIGGRRAPALPAALIGAGPVLQMQGRAREAAACYSVLAAAAPSMVIARMNLGIAQRNIGEYAASAETLSKVIDQLPHESPAWLTAHFNMGINQLALEEPTQALRHLTLVSQYAPDNPSTWLFLSRAYEGVGQEGDARQAIERARALDPDLTEGFIGGR